MQGPPLASRPPLTMTHGDHVCAIVDNRSERDHLLASFLQDGLAAGHKCVFVLSEQDPWRVTHGIGCGIDVGRCRAQQQLELLGGGNQRLTPREFSIGRLVAFWHDIVSDAAQEGYEAAHLGADTGWWRPKLPGTSALIEYESELNTLTDAQPVAMLCLYQGRHRDGRLVLDLMRTHPRLVIGEVELRNPYC